ncbi:MAG: PDDEXK nuclease domain-containing protein [Bacteroidales bacterium]|nr:PDDEXK nuclease domain-containing protein [Bacteroidales bacterium]
MSNLKSISPLYSTIREIINEARASVSRTVNFVVVLQNWEIGRAIVEEEQKGEAKAAYGKYLIKELSLKLIDEFGKGYSQQHLKFCRQFYNLYPIGHALRSQLQPEENKPDGKSYALRSQSGDFSSEELLSKSHPLFQMLSPKLTWTHYRVLLRVEDADIRDFYIKESIINNWSYRALDRQIKSLYYERLLSSKEKQPVVAEMIENTKKLQAEDVLKDPVVLEFLQLKENRHYLESELEQAWIDKMNDFLLELGKGFAFVARQKRISSETKDFYIDLVFYNYLLKCFVLIDLKTEELSHQDIGQMDMYVRLYEDKYKPKGDNPTIGLILCTYADKTIVKYSVLNESKQLFASKYKLYLPSEKELREELERERNQIEFNINK